MHGFWASTALAWLTAAAAFGCAPIPIVTPNGTRQSDAAPANEVPVVIRRGLVLVPVHVDGVDRELTFLLDFGAPTLVDAAVAEELGSSRPADRALVDGAGHDVPVSAFDVEGLRVGTLHMPHVSAFVAELPRFPFLCARLDGILGVGAGEAAGFLDRTAIEIDYPGSKIVLAPSGDDLTLGGARVRVRRRDIPPDPTTVYTAAFAEVEIDGRHRWAILDTGNSGEVDVSRGFFAALGRSFDEPGLVTRRGALSQTAASVQSGVSYETRLDSLRLGGLELRGVPITVERHDDAIVAPDPHGRVMLGYHLLRNFRVVMDLGAGFARFVPVAGADPSASDRMLGFSWLEREGKVVVTTLVTRGPADRAGIELDDELLAFDGAPMRPGDVEGQCAIRRASEQLGDEAHSIRVRHDGVERDVVLHAEPLLPVSPERPRS